MNRSDREIKRKALWAVLKQTLYWLCKNLPFYLFRFRAVLCFLRGTYLRQNHASAYAPYRFCMTIQFETGWFTPGNTCLFFLPLLSLSAGVRLAVVTVISSSLFLSSPHHFLTSLLSLLRFYPRINTLGKG